MILPACLALLLAGVSCTVKENRTDCPCYLHVSFTDPEASGDVDMMGWNADVLFRNSVRIEDCRPSWTRPVDKCVLVFSACKGIGRAAAEGHRIGIPAGCQADSLYAYYEEVDATGDDAEVQVSLRKQFATVFLDIRKPADVVRSCRFFVEGNTCGFDRLDFSPLPGLFLYEPVPRTGENIVTFRVPRQSDDSLRITIRPAGSSALTFPLGEYIRQLGYSWKTEELQDIYVSVDLARGQVEVRVADWEEGMTFTLVEI